MARRVSQTLEMGHGPGTLRAGTLRAETPVSLACLPAADTCEGTMQIEALRLFIREKLQDGRLPHEQISQVQSRPADGQKCDACEKPVTMAQFVVTGTTLAGRGSIQLHVECFQLWDDERSARRASPRHRVRTRDVGPTVAPGDLRLA